MKWANLNKDLCPKCGISLKDKEKGKACMSKSCGFFITNTKRAEVIDSMDRNQQRKNLEGYGMEDY